MGDLAFGPGMLAGSQVLPVSIWDIMADAVSKLTNT